MYTESEFKLYQKLSVGPQWPLKATVTKHLLKGINKLSFLYLLNSFIAARPRGTNRHIPTYITVLQLYSNRYGGSTFR